MRTTVTPIFWIARVRFSPPPTWLAAAALAHTFRSARLSPTYSKPSGASFARSCALAAPLLLVAPVRTDGAVEQAEACRDGAHRFLVREAETSQTLRPIAFARKRLGQHLVVHGQGRDIEVRPALQPRLDPGDGEGELRQLPQGPQRPAAHGLGSRLEQRVRQQQCAIEVHGEEATARRSR